MRLNHTLKRRLVFFVFTAICALHCASFVGAQNSGFAQGILFYMTPGDTEATAKATLYRKYRQSAPRSFFDVGAASELAVENGLMLKMIDLNQAFQGNLASDAQRQSLIDLVTTLDAWASRSPKTRDLCNSVNKIINTTIARYDNGEVRLNGVWGSKASYMNSLASAAKAEQDALQKRQKQFENLKYKYPAKIADYIISERLQFNQSLKKYVQNSKQSNVGLVLDESFKQRSKMIPEPDAGLEAGVFSSDLESGPAVMWVAADSRIIALRIGFIMELDIESDDLVNTAEMTQAKNFISRINERIYYEVPTCIAASKITTLLKRKKLAGGLDNKTYSISSFREFDIDVDVHPRVAGPEGKSTQSVVISLFYK